MYKRIDIYLEQSLWSVYLLFIRLAQSPPYGPVCRFDSVHLLFKGAAVREMSGLKRKFDANEASDMFESTTNGEANPWTGNPYSQQYYDILEKRKTLPVFEHKDEVVQAVRENPVTILVGETGSGKTTQIPQFLAEANRLAEGESLVVACTQPRQLAAISVAGRVADEMDVKLGQHVRQWPHRVINHYTFLGSVAILFVSTTLVAH